MIGPANRGRLAIVATLTWLGAIGASPAAASTVARTPPPEGMTTATLTVRGAPGETNWLVVDPSGGRPVGSALVTDRAAPLTAGDGCSAIDTHTASCPFPIGTVDQAGGQIVIDGGDGDDVIDTTRFSSSYYGDAFRPTSARLMGGSGDDVLVGVMLDGADGGPGRDVLEAQGGSSGAEVSGGADDDYIRAEEEYVVVEADGDGSDVIVAPVVSFAARREPIRVFLRRGGTSDGDYLTPGVVRTVFGGAGPDELHGSAGPDELFGLTGRDTIYGRGGDDVIAGAGAEGIITDPDDDTFVRARESPGNRLDGGAGEDRVLMTPRDRVRCGPGVDLAEPIAPAASPVDCERQRVGIADGTYVIGVPRLERRRLSVPFGRYSTTRSGSLLVRVGRQRVGTVGPQDPPFTARVPVGARAARAIRRGRPISLCPVRRESTRDCARAHVRSVAGAAAPGPPPQR